MRCFSCAAGLVVYSLGVSGCLSSLELQSGEAVVGCMSDAECPIGFRCADGLNACVQSDSDPQGAIVLSATLTPEVVGPSDDVLISVIVSEPVFDVPVVRLPNGSSLEALEPIDGSQFVYRYSATPDAAPSVELTIEMFDLSGNRTFEALTTIEIDATPPVLSDLAWTDGNVLSNPTSLLSFAGEASSEASVVAELIDPSGAALVDVFVGATPTPSGLALVGAVELSQVDLALLAAAGSVAVRVMASDPVGNVRSETLPVRLVDAVAPETELSGTPGVAPITRDVSFTFTSAAIDLAAFECRLDPAPFEPCTSPWEPALTTSGPHRAEVRAVDEAGNVDSTPAQHVFEVAAVWRSIEVARTIACGISTDERMWCWGRGNVATGFNGDGATSPVLISDDRRWSKVFVGENMVCAFDSADELYCWGEGPLGLGLGEGVDYARPVLLPGGPWRSVALAEQARCAIRLDGTLWCWGPGEGAGAAQGSLVPLQIGVESDWTSVSVAPETSGAACGLRSDGSATRAWCWGDNGDREVGDGTTMSRIDPVEVSVEGIGPVNDWLAVTTGSNNACGIRAVSETEGTLWCWGQNAGGVLGLPFDDNPPDQNVVQVGTATNWTQISLGMERSCGLRSDGAAYCWGGRAVNSGGESLAQLHTLDGERIPAPTQPMPVGNPDPWGSVSAGEEFACGLDGNGVVTCWGNNAFGRLGGGVTSNESVPLTPIAGPSNWSRIVLDGSSSSPVGCGIAGGSVYCWGSSGVKARDVATDGSLDVDRSIPTRVGDATDWVELRTGRRATCGIREQVSGERTGWCFGARPLGIAGDPAPSETPVQVGFGGIVETTWQRIDPDGEWALGVLERNPGERTLWQWGEPPVSAGGVIVLPEQLGTATDWLTVDNSGTFACGIRAQVAGNTLWCWGDASSLDLDVDDSAVPEQVGVGAPYEFGWVSVSGQCGIRDDGSRHSLWCWGRLGDITGGSSVDTPTEITAPELRVFVRGEGIACGLDLDGGLWCVGSKTGLTTAGPVFVQVAPEISWQRIALFDEQLCAIDGAGALYCAGSDNEGQRGSGQAWGPFFPEVPR